MIIDISLPLFDNMPIWPGDPKVEFNKHIIKLNGISTIATEMKLSTHSGTHLDLPGHFDIKVNEENDLIDLNYLSGECLVVETPYNLETIKNYFNNSNEKEKRILFKSNINKGKIEYLSEVQPISNEIINYLLRMRINIIGIDSPSPEAFSAVGFPIHHKLFNKGVVVIENLNLAHIKPGYYRLLCFPLSVKGIYDGIPCRVALEI